METEIVPKAGIPFQGVTARKLRKVVSFSTIGVALSLVRGFQEARQYLRAFKTEAVVGAGGYVAAAAALAGKSLGIPTVILAPDSIPGRTNRMLARFARKICVVFDETAAHFPAERTIVTGLPLRAGIVAPADVDRVMARARFSPLARDRFTVLVIGGSQGARAINNVVVTALPELLSAGVQVLHQIGPNNLSDVRDAVAALHLEQGAAYCPVGFLAEDEVPSAYRAADVIVCRGGISTLSEVTANGLPAIVIPLPTAYANHQTANAMALARVGAALCRKESGVDSKGLIAELLQFRDSPERLRTMASASRAISRPEAADTVADIILNL